MMKIENFQRARNHKRFPSMKRTHFLILILLSISLLGCVPAEKECSVDTDCVKAVCCHASDAVNVENAPDCSGILCTMDCMPETTDCGQGEIKCLKGVCEVVLN